MPMWNSTESKMLTLGRPECTMCQSLKQKHINSVWTNHSVLKLPQQQRQAFLRCLVICSSPSWHDKCLYLYHLSGSMGDSDTSFKIRERRADRRWSHTFDKISRDASWDGDPLGTAAVLVSSSTKRKQNKGRRFAASDQEKNILIEKRKRETWSKEEIKKSNNIHYSMETGTEEQQHGARNNNHPGLRISGEGKTRKKAAKAICAANTSGK